MHSQHLRIGQPDLYPPEDGYIPLTRHSSRRYPHWQSAYDDRFPSSYSDKWAEENQNKNRKYKKIQ